VKPPVFIDTSIPPQIACAGLEKHGEGRRGCWRYLGGIAIVYPIGHTPNSSDTGRESFAFPKSTNEKIARDSYLPVLQAVLVIWPQSEARSGFGVRIALSRGGRRMP
jgi:hypothetical protein